jgi:hypothetical protein
MGMSLSSTVTNLIPRLHYQLSFAAGMSVFSPMPPDYSSSTLLLSLSVILKSADFVVIENVVMSRVSGHSATAFCC